MKVEEGLFGVAFCDCGLGRGIARVGLGRRSSERRAGRRVRPRMFRWRRCQPRWRSEDALGTTSHERVEAQGCPHCAGRAVVGWGRSHGLLRFRCKSCGRTFNALTKTPMAHLRKKDRWLDHARAMIEGKSLAKTAALCGVHPTTAFRWRHRFLRAPASDKPRSLKGIARVGFRDVRSQAHGLHPILVRRHYEGFGVEVLKVLHDDVSTPESGPVTGWSGSPLTRSSSPRARGRSTAPCVPVLRLDKRPLASGDFIEGRGVKWGCLVGAGSYDHPRGKDKTDDRLRHGLSPRTGNGADDRAP
jgi:transposase-like protein